MPESDNEKIIFTNGCFDLLHPGHLSLLEFCSTLGRVVVGMNSDASVKRLKGESRPILNQKERRYSLSACKWVSDVHVFDEDTPLELIARIKPDIIVKGSEYKGFDIIGSEYAEVVLFDHTWPTSTSKIISRILASTEK